MIPHCSPDPLLPAPGRPPLWQSIGALLLAAVVAWSAGVPAGGPLPPELGPGALRSLGQVTTWLVGWWGMEALAIVLASVGLLGLLRMPAAVVHAAARTVPLVPVAVGLLVHPGAEWHWAPGLLGSLAAYYLVGWCGLPGATGVFVAALSAAVVGPWVLNRLRVVIAVRGVGAASEHGLGPEAPAATPAVQEPESCDMGDPGDATLARAYEPVPPAAVGAGSLAASESRAATAAPGPRRTRRSMAAQRRDAAAIWDLPPTSLLDEEPPRPAGKKAGRSSVVEQTGDRLIQALTTFGIQARLVGSTVGPVVTQFEVEPAPGVKVRRIASLSADLALALRAQAVRIQAPIPGRGAVGIEVPNPVREPVHLRALLEDPSFEEASGSLPIALGKDLAGRPVVADLARMPHLLIAGATGSGKSVCVNTIITSLVYRHTPATLRLLMVDPKMVELSVYNGLPHLRHPVIVQNRDAAALLKWAVLEMNERYALLAANGCRNLGEFNARVLAGAALVRARATTQTLEVPYAGGSLPFIVVVIDELADLMMTVQAEVETPIAMLAQKARAIGIHLILATQRPSVNVITGLIKANFPSRIAFRVASQVDSRTVLDGAGAESLLGYGDMLFLPPGVAEPARLQGAFVSSEETERLVDWHREAAADRRAGDLDAQELDILEYVRAVAGEGEGEEGAVREGGDRDPLLAQAGALCVQAQGGSTSLLQRRLKIGYGRAARIVDQLEGAGVLGPANGSRPRDVLCSLDALNDLLAES